MNMPLLNLADKTNREWKLPSQLWDGIPLPNTVAPSFETCNISRKYELEIRIGLAHGTADGVRPELVVSPLRLPVQVYSGVAPPAQLLRAMTQGAQPPGTARPSEAKVDKAPASQTSQTPHTPIQDYGSFPAPAGTIVPPPPDFDPDDVPPSYEDAMAEDIAPVDGPRRDYNVSETASSPDAFNPDSKGGLGRRVSERLFSSNSPGTPRRISFPLFSNSNQVQEDGDQSAIVAENEQRPALPQRGETTGKR